MKIKTLKSTNFIIIILLFIMSVNSCTDDITSINNGNPPALGGYDENEAGEIMTLAALSYTAENNPNHAEIKDSLILQLANTNYTTGGNWKLVWGPGISPDGGNLMYVAADTTGDSSLYTIAIRGTDWIFPLNIKEDMEVWKLDRYPFTAGNSDSVAVGSLDGLNTLLAITDNGKNLATFLNGIQGSNLKMFITGHSLGGALATMLSAWFVDNGYTNLFSLETYTFAAPTVGNESFVEHYNSIMINTNSPSHRVVNSKDFVPFGWAGLQDIIPDEIPTFVPIPIGIVIIAVDLYLDSIGVKYEHVNNMISLGTLTPTNCNSGNEEENYFCWVEFEHDHNNYLRLLNADTVATSRRENYGF